MDLRAWIVGLAICLIAVGAGAGRAHAQAGAGDAGWTKWRTEHFEIYSNATPTRIGEFAQELETVWELLWPGDESDRIQVLFFRDAGSFLPFQVASQAPAFSQVGRGHERIVAYDAGKDLGAVLRHELSHLTAHRVGLQLPAWMSEGMAEVNSTIRAEEGKSCATIGEPIVSHLRLLATPAGAPWTVSRLFSVSQGDLDRMASADRQQFYARSWQLVLFLMESELWEERGEEFLFVQEKTSSESALWEVFRLTPRDLDAQLESFVPPEHGMEGRCIFRDGPPQPPPPPGKFTLRELPALLSDQPVSDASAKNAEQPRFAGTELSLEPWELSLIQADVLGILGKRDVAASIYARLAAEFPDVAEIRESQGMLAFERQDLEGAQRHFEEAVARSSRNGTVYHQLATLRCGMESREPACLEWVEKALTLGEASRETRLYAINFALNVRDFPRALRYIEEANPESDNEKVEFLLKIAYAHYQLEQFDEARKAIADAESFEESRRHARQIADTKRAIEQREHFLVQKRLFEGALDDPALQEAVRRAFAAFEAEPNAKLEVGQLREVLCEGGRLALLADTPSGRLRLDVENPMDLMILTGNQRRRELEITCGPQQAASAQFGYLLTGEGTETRGLLRILRFETAAAGAVH